MLNQEIWKNSKVLVTGHTGFKGSWLSIWLKMMGAEVIGYAFEPYTERDNFVATKMEDKITHIVSDVRDYENLFDVFKKYEPKFVFHLAAQPLVRESYINPKETYDVNIGGTVNVLECCRLTDSVRVIVNVTLDKCYENMEWIWGYRENDRLGGYDPYSSSKAGSEIVTQAYKNSFFHPERINNHGKSLSSARSGNVIGGGDWRTDRLVPDCIRALERNEPIIIRSPDAIRPWQHVLEPLSGYLLLASKMAEEPEVYCDAWNFGPEEKYLKSVGEVADLVVENWGKGSWESHLDKNGPHEAYILRLDITKALSLLGWKPVWDIEQAVEATVDWYKSYQDRGTYVDGFEKYFFEASNDNHNWTVLYSGGSQLDERADYEEVYYTWPNETAYQYVRLRMINISTNDHKYHCQVREIEFYGSFKTEQPQKTSNNFN